MAKKRKSTGIISDWAIQAYGSRNSMCTDGQAVFDRIVELEESGKSAKAIVALFPQQEIDDYVVGKLEGLFQETEDDSQPADALRDLRDEEGGVYFNFDDFSKEFKAAVKKELKRLEAIEDKVDDPSENYGDTPTFTRKGDKVVVTFK